MASPRVRKAVLLESELAASRGTIAEIKQVAKSLNLMEDRYMARPAAELLVARGDAQAAELSAGLAATPVLGKDPKGDRLRAAFKQAMLAEGIPADVDRMARKFYAERGQGKKQAGAQPKGFLRRLFGGR